MTIWADADSLQAELRRLLCRRANREAAAAAAEGRPARFRSAFVAARMPPLDSGPGTIAIVVGESLRVVEGPREDPNLVKSEGASLRVVEGPREDPNLVKSEGASLRVVSVPRRGTETADDRIAADSRAGDLAVTRDLPLAERLAAKGLRVLNDRGEVFSAENARERRSLRDRAVELRALGLAPESPRRSSWGSRELKAFADALDREIAKAIKER